ncbi:prostate stem cell antigen [Anabas testudineus]|uniref:UPAR/Ly6 domain-containing protein n=1 Tax=Anabas testudineus TaxID=64144 RepID=A0A3Q1KFZ0_ANATE|nr:prostate stem cell antigen [Anabas testudineus]
MKMFFSLLSLSLLFSSALSLTCYVCSSSSTNDECNKNTQDCQVPLTTCMTVVDTLGAVKAIVKQCASQSTCLGAASTASVDVNGNGNRVSCCNYDYCNYSGAGSIHVNTTLMLLTVGLLMLLSH